MKPITLQLALLALMTTMMANAQTGLTINSAKVNTVPIRDANHAVWNSAEPVLVTVLPQNLTNPMLQTPSVNQVRVRSINNGFIVAFLLEWADSTRDVIVDSDKFCDQVAIQIPMDVVNIPAFMMGNKDGKVHIIHWKAAWQNDIEQGFRNVKDAYPNYWVDIYPLQEKQGDGTAAFARDLRPGEVIDPDARNYMHGAYAGNAMSIFDRRDPSEECVAVGFGSLTTQIEQNATAWGVWENNSWKVIFSRRLVSPDKNDAPIPEKSKIAFAVWNGSKMNIGARKHYTLWSDLVIKK